MTLQEFRYIVALADTGHFGQAAEQCHISQSTLSTQIKKLEDYLGVLLFDRSLKRVEPTSMGAEIVASARLILEEAQRIRDLSQQRQNPMDRTVRLGIIPTLGPYYLPHVLTTVQERHPHLRMLLREEMTPVLLAHLADGLLDGGIVALPVLDAGLEVAPLFEEPFLAAVPAQHPLATQRVITIDDLASAGLLLLDEGHCLRDQALEACHLQGVKSEEVRATSLETLRQMVAMNLGVTLIPAMAAHPSAGHELPICFRPLQAPGASRQVGLIWRKRSPVAETMRQLAETLLQVRPSSVDAISGGLG
ncbi:MAG: LysR family transcriptional regulator [Betaproteobacteria bacterium]|nr:MAG: LysR family transcriptional regulator [Betaproteobacteria bacterium]